MAMTDEELNARFASIEASIKAEGTVTRRHFDVVAEGLRIDIKIVAEGLRDSSLLRGSVSTSI
jgi:hypothetical protein